MGPSNVYPRITTGPVESLDSILDVEDADAWNCGIASDTQSSDLDQEVYDTAQEQVQRNLLSAPMTKKEVDKLFGRGAWRAIRRRGLRQNEKIRGIDNARASKTNFAAYLQDTFMTTPHDIAVQILSWLFSEGGGGLDLRGRKFGPVGLGADDLADAYHGIPNAPSQLGLCVVAITNPHWERMDFFYQLRALIRAVRGSGEL